jgi:molybdenum cofactor cytidylyltransferase
LKLGLAMAEGFRVAAIVLAAGRSTRMGGANKLLATIFGTPMARRVIEVALASQADPVLVVTGHQGAEVGAALAGLDVTFIDNADFATGLASSLKAGVRAVPANCDGALILLGDMPRIAAEDLERLIAAFAQEKGRTIVVPTYGGRRGNPVLWPAALFPEMLALEGDRGAKQLLDTHAAMVTEIDLGTDAIFADVDTPDELERVRADCRPGRSAKRGEPSPRAND